MVDLFIYTDDDLMTGVLRRLISHYGYDAVCQVGGDISSFDITSDVFWIGSDAPEGLSSSQVFETEVRAGAVLDGVEALLLTRRMNMEFLVGPYTLQAGRNALMSDQGVEVMKVTDTEKRLLLVLAEAGGVVLRDDLLQSVWGMRPDLDTHTVETHIYRLRQKLELDPSNPLIILTRNDGYCLASS